MSDEIHEEFSDRGFVHLEPVETDYGAEVRIYESSSAEEAKLWMACEQPPPAHAGALPQGRVSVHMTIEQAERIHAQLGHMIERVKKSWGIA